MRTSRIEIAKPKQIVWRDERWVLEVECLVPVSERILRPSMHAIEGREAIQMFLEASPEGRHLSAAASHLMDGPSPPTNQSRAFAPDGDRWSAALSPLASELVRGALPAAAVAPAPVAALDDEKLSRLIGAFESIAVRMQRLEDKISRGIANLSSLQPPGAAGPIQVPAYGGGNLPAPPPPAPAAAPPPLAPPQASAEAVRSSVPTPAPEALAPEPKLKMPTVKDFRASLRQLVGDDVTIEAVKKPTFDLEDQADRCYGCEVLDDKGEVVGAMLADLLATVWIGGGLMMLPHGALAEQVRKVRPSDDAIEAMSEVLNTLCALFNYVPGNPHVRTRPAARLDPTEHPWMLSPLARADYKEGKGGFIVLLSK
jgi:hypothetical protein